MDPQRMGKFLGICVLAAVVGGLTGGPTHAQRLALLPQRITFDQPQVSVVGQPVTLSAATDADLVVSFRSDTPELCTVSGATVVPRAGGQCVIIATQPGNARYLPAESIQREFPVSLAA